MPELVLPVFGPMKGLFVLFATIITTGTWGQSSAGCIDLQRCISVLPEYSAEQMEFAVRSAELDDTLKAMVSEYQRFVNQGLPHGSRLDSVVVAKAMNEISSREAAVEAFVEHAKGALLELENESEVRLRRIILQQLEPYCEEKGLGFIVECDALLFGPDCLDHTTDFIEFLGKRR